ncbi:abortive infection protein [Rhodovulum sp. NI22]|nr:abortive infection protein [Rhodovulum sp. NI22]
MMERADLPAGRDASRMQLWAEFLALYIVAPVAVAIMLPAQAMFPVLFAVTACGIALLHLTEGFAWHDLSRNRRAIDWPAVAAFSGLTLMVSLAVMLATRPEALLFLPRHQPLLTLMILLLYPVLSALPQELVFRPLFFRRYGALLPGPKRAIVLNAALFSLAHLMYWSWIVAAMTFAGGLVFAWAYEARRSFAMAVLMHSIAGGILFTLGLGIYFYSGNVVRPF